MPALMNDYLARCRYETSCSCLRNPDNNLTSILTSIFPSYSNSCRFDLTWTWTFAVSSFTG